MLLKEWIKDDSKIEVKSTKCHTCKTELEYEHTSVHHDGTGIFYCYCPKCDHGKNVSWKKLQ